MLFGKQKKVKCPDGVRYVYKNPDDAFPLVANDFKARADAAAKAIEGLNAELGVEYSRQVAGFFVQLDAASSSIQLLFRNAYEVFYKTNPCQGWAILVDEAKRIISNEHRDRQILLEIRKIQEVAAAQPDDHAAIDRAVSEGVAKVGDDLGRTKAGERMAATEETAAEWGEVQVQS